MIKLVKKIMDIFKSLKFKQKLLLSYFILIIIPIAILTYISYNKSATIITTKMEELAGQALNQSSTFLSYRLGSIENALDTFTSNVEVRDMLERDRNTYSIGKQIDDARKLESFLNDFKIYNNIYKVRLYVRDKLLYSNQNIDFFNLKELPEMEWYKQTETYGGGIFWTSTYICKYLVLAGYEEKKVISAVRIIKSTKDNNEIVGALCVDLLEEDVRGMIDKAVLNNKGRVFLLNANNEIVTVSHNNPKSMNNLTYIRDFSGAEGLWKKDYLNGERIIAGSRSLSDPLWKLLVIVPISEVVTPNMKLKNEIVVLVLIVGSVAYLLAYYISYFSTKRITKLSATMREVQKGNFDIDLYTEIRDEIGELQNDFSYMVKKLSLLMQEQYITYKKLRNSELKALQSQINPHFLYNTLDMIGWMAKKIKAYDISAIVNTMARFYKISLSNGKDVISIREEINHVRLYMEIQNQRYQGCIRLIVNMEEEVMEFGIIKLVMQPLVENAILHGIMEKDDKKGHIEISGVVETDTVIITISDDGIGMPEEKVAGITQKDTTSERSGYGIRNINERLKVCYGEEYGLFFRSIPGAGTEVKIKVPAVKTELVE
jgi:two-component system, sensor histidine kinase YesM